MESRRTASPRRPNDWQEKRILPSRRAVGWEYKFFARLKQILPSGLIEKILTVMYLPKP